MIHEYALEPELVAGWHDLMSARYFRDQFGHGTGRVVSQYPGRWAGLVWDAFHTAYRDQAGELGRKRIEVLLAELKGSSVKRPDLCWDKTLTWLQNAAIEHHRYPFHAILACTNPSGDPDILVGEEIAEGEHEAWRARRSVITERKATAMAASVAGLLRCSKRILFVDPYFRADSPRYRNSLGAFFRCVSTKAPSIQLEMHAGNVAGNLPPWELFRKDCERWLPDLLPRGLSLTVYRWTHREEGERLHNRYILTEVGGVTFGAGLDEGHDGASDDVTLLDKAAYQNRIEIYSGRTAFDPEGSVEIYGRRNQPA